MESNVVNQTVASVNGLLWVFTHNTLSFSRTYHLLPIYCLNCTIICKWQLATLFYKVTEILPQKIYLIKAIDRMRTFGYRITDLIITLGIVKRTRESCNRCFLICTTSSCFSDLINKQRPKSVDKLLLKILRIYTFRYLTFHGQENRSTQNSLPLFSSHATSVVTNVIDAKLINLQLSCWIW